MAHPLDGAFARTNRAEEHLADLKARLRGFRAAENERTTVSIDMKDPGPEMAINFPHSIPPAKISILVGETIYNLRAALDYLVYALAAHDFGKPVSGTQFPIEEYPNGFAGRKDIYLKGLNPAHVAAIEKLQPYNGCEWTRRLQAISNPDKHRHLVVTQSRSGNIIAAINSVPVGLPNEKNAYEPVSGRDVYVQVNVASAVTFDDGTPIETIEILKSQVAETLEAFKPEF